MARSQTAFRWEIDLLGYLTFVSPEAAFVLGFPQAELLGYRLFHELEPTDFALRQHEVTQRNGSKIRLLSRGVAIRNSAGERVGYRGNSRLRTDDLSVVERYQGLFDNMLSGFALQEMVYDADGRACDYIFLAVNPAFERMTGLESEQVVGRSALDVLPGLEPFWIETYGQVALTGESVTFERYSKSLSRYYQVNAFCPEPLQFACIFVDQTRLHLAASVFENSQEAVMITDTENRILEVNPAFTEITGYSPQEVVGKTPSVLSSGRQSPEFYAELWETLQRTDRWRGEIWNRRKDGEVYAEMLSITIVRDSQGGLLRYLAVFTDISRVKEQEHELQRIAHFDVLTGVPNRRLLKDRLEQAIAHSRRTGKSLAICYLDLDGFKPVNDNFGHAVGDQVLIEVTRRLHGVLREVDTLARLGGDEFVLLLTELGHPQEISRILDRVLASVNTPLLIEDHKVRVSASIGVTVFPQDLVDCETLIRHADQAMYRAKEQGKSRYVFFEPQQRVESLSDRRFAEQLSTALSLHQFFLHYQPKINLRTREVLGVEALVRWQHPELGLLLPGKFLGRILGSSLELPLGRWVLESALEQLSQWRSLGMGLCVSINLSPHQIKQDNFLSQAVEAMAAFPNLVPGDLEFEIVESSALSDLERVTDVIEQGRRLGFRFSLDDFGTSNSSLAHLRQLRVDALKIDQSFVQNMMCQAADRDTVESIVRLAMAFDRQVVAEGVESEELVAHLLELGCEFGQGFSIAPPMPAHELQKWLAQWSKVALIS